MVGKARNFYIPTTVALCGLINVSANTVLLQLLFKILHYECVQEHLFVHHSLKRLDFEFDLKILVLLSCYVRVIKRSFFIYYENIFVIKSVSIIVGCPAASKEKHDNAR